MVLVWEWGGVALDKAAPGQLEAKILIGESSLLQTFCAQKRGLQKSN